MYKGDFPLKTKIITTAEAVPGMIVAEDIFGLQDYLIIPAHSELTNHSITRLKFYAINQIKIEINEDGEPERMDYGNTASDTYSEYIKSTLEFKKFNQAYDSVVTDFKKKIATVNGQLCEPIDAASLTDDMEKIIHESRNNTHIIHMFQCLLDSDDVTYTHSVSVAILCNAIGRWFGYSDEDIQVLTLAGMLHDIGKVTVPSAILHKPSRLTPAEYEIIKEHPQHGYDLLKDQNLDNRILNAVLMHHERTDGSGYPNGLKGDEIDDFAQIVAIADVYVAMTNPRVYRQANCPFDAMSVFEQDGFQQFSPKFLLPFLEGMANSYINCTVQLNDDRIGEIIMIDSQHITRPVIKIENQFIDLAKIKRLHIQKIL
jgi:putative nucleotidyltransferase with HDIG domain